MVPATELKRRNVSARVFDIAIIGGGVIGLSLARALVQTSAQTSSRAGARENLRIAVIDAGAAKPQATHAAAGMLAPSFETEAKKNGKIYADAFYQFCAASLNEWPAFAKALEEDTGIDIDYRRDGILGVAFGEDGVRNIGAQYASLQERGAWVELLSGDEARALEPALSPDVSAALYAVDDAQVDARKLLAALRASIEEKIGPILPEMVERITGQGEGYRLHLANGESVTAEKVVLANGAAAGRLGLDLPKPPVFPVKGEAVAVQMSGEDIRHVIRGPGAYLCPKAEGRVIIGATELRHRDDDHVEERAIAMLLEKGAAIVPAAASFPELERWAGVRPATPDGGPILGRDIRGPENFFLALGHYRNGILLAPESAKRLAAEILGDEQQSLNLFRPETYIFSE